MGQLFRLFSSFRTNITIVMTNKCEKWLSSKWHWDSNPQPSEHDSHPITTRPGLPPVKNKLTRAFLLLLSIDKNKINTDGLPPS